MTEEVNNLTMEEVSTMLGRKVESKEDVGNYVKNLRSLVGDQENAVYRKVFGAMGIEDMSEVTPEKVEEISNLFKGSAATKIEAEDLKKYKTFAEEAGIDIVKADAFKINRLLNSIDSKTVLPAKSAPAGSDSKKDKVEVLGQKVLKHGRQDDKVDLVATYLELDSQFQGDEAALRRARNDE